jgi:TonB family protein
MLQLVVDADGLPRDIQVTRSLGMGLDEKAIEAVSKWRFEPARKNGQPVPVLIHVEVDFALH